MARNPYPYPRTRWGALNGRRRVPFNGKPMKDPISQDLLAALFKSAPTATVAVATYDPTKHLSWAVMIVSLLVGLSQFFSTIVKNWGDWMVWWRARGACVARMWGRARGR